jgi:hypothetical protein
MPVVELKRSPAEADSPSARAAGASEAATSRASTSERITPACDPRATRAIGEAPWTYRRASSTGGTATSAIPTV